MQKTAYHSFEIHWTVLFPYLPTNNWLPLETIKVKINELEKKLTWFNVAYLGSSLSTRLVAAGSISFLGGGVDFFIRLEDFEKN